MNETPMTLKHWISQMRYQEMLSQVERRRMIDAALASSPRASHPARLDIRAFVAKRLNRAGFWLMAQAAPGQGSRA